jgi:hypothetical protein
MRRLSPCRPVGAERAVWARSSRPPVPAVDRDTFLAMLQKRFEASQPAIHGDLAHLRADHDRAIGRDGAAALLNPENRDTTEDHKSVQLEGNHRFLLAFDKARSWRCGQG